MDNFSPSPMGTMSQQRMQGQPPDFASQIPPQYQHRIEPNNPVQKMLLQRVGSLNPADLKALDSIPDAAVEVLKRLLPEVDFLLDQITKDAMMGQPQPAAMPPQAPEAVPAAPPRPMSRLGQV